MFETLIKQLEGLKSSLLSIAAIIYGLGLVNWAVFSYRKSLGLVSGLEPQYFVGGLIPFLIFVLLYLMFKSNFHFLTVFRTKLTVFGTKINRKSKGVFRILRITLITILYFSYFLWVGAYIIYIIRRLIFKEVINVENYIPFLVTCICLSIIITLILPFDAFPRLHRRTFQQKLRALRSRETMLADLRNDLKLYATMYAIVGVIAYSFAVYPKIPQELGGARPKLCILEVKKGILSDTSVNVLFADTSKTTLRSKILVVYFYSGDKILFKPHKDASEVYEIKRSDIILINWFPLITSKISVVLIPHAFLMH